MEANAIAGRRESWNKGKIVGQKAPFKLKDIGRCGSAFNWQTMRHVQASMMSAR